MGRLKAKTEGELKKIEVGLKNYFSLSIWVGSYLVIFSFLMVFMILV